LNATYTVIKNWTLIKLENPSRFHTKGKFTGASDLLLNADLTFFEWNDKNNNLTTTIAYTYFSDRVNAIGTSNRGDLVDKAFG
jgi:hypothetical protein